MTIQASGQTSVHLTCLKARGQVELQRNPADGEAECATQPR